MAKKPNRFLSIPVATESSAPSVPVALPSGNRFKAIPVATEKPRATLPPRREYTLGDVALRMPLNIVPSAANAILGISNAVTNPAETMHTAIALPGAVLEGMTPEGARQGVNTQDAAFRDAIRQGLVDRYGDPRNPGTIPQALLRTLVEDPVGLGLEATNLPGARGLVGRGARAVNNHLIAPINQPGMNQTIGRVGAMTNIPGTVARAAGNALAQRVVRPAFNAADPRATFLTTAVEEIQGGRPNPAGGHGRAVTDAIRNNTGTVPGYNPTVLERVAPTGATHFASVAKDAQKVASTEAKAINAANDEALVGAIDGIVQTPATRAAAEATRQANADANYGIVRAHNVPSDATLEELLATPPGREAVSTAQEMAATDRVPYQIGAYTPATTIHGTVRPPVPLGLGNLTYTPQKGRAVVVPPTYPRYPGESIQNIKTSLDKQITGIPKDANAAAMQGKVKNLKAEFIDWADAHVPGFEQGRAQFAEDSAPINRMDVGQALRNALVKPLMDDVVGDSSNVLRSAEYARTLADVPNTLVTKATGRPLNLTAEQVLTPDEMSTVTSVGETLSNRALADELARAGAGSAPDIKQIAGTVRAMEQPNLMDRGVALWNTVVRRLSAQMSRDEAIAVARQFVNDPEGLANALDAARAREMRGQFRADQVRDAARLITREGTPALPGYMNHLPGILDAPQVYNTMSPRQREERNALNNRR